jgi:hypothetical protein
MFPTIAAFGMAAAIASFTVQYKTNRLEREIARLEREIRDADAETKVLKTELARLTTIARIKVLGSKFLPKFKNITQGDVGRAVDIPIDPAFE